MSEVSINDFEFVEDQHKKPNLISTKIKYGSMSSPKKSTKKKYTCCSFIILLLEITFIFAAIFISFKKAMNVIKKKRGGEESSLNSLSNKKKINEQDINDMNLKVDIGNGNDDDNNEDENKHKKSKKKKEEEKKNKKDKKKKKNKNQKKRKKEEEEKDEKNKEEDIDEKYEKIDKKYEKIDKKYEEIDKIYEEIDKKKEEKNNNEEEKEKKEEELDKKYVDIDKKFEDIDKMHKFIDRKFKDIDKNEEDKDNKEDKDKKENEDNKEDKDKKDEIKDKKDDNENKNESNDKKDEKDQNKDKNNNNKEIKDLNDIKVCLCTQAKNENKYIKEFVEFYENKGVDKIFIYDNNEENGEKFDEVIGDYISKKFVKIEDWRGEKKVLFKMMNNCYKKQKKKYDWIIFYAPNEFIHLKNYTNIKNFLNEDKFKKCDKIYLNWIYHTDNNFYHYENKSVQLRFPKTEPKPTDKDGLKHNYVKTIIRGHLGDIKINSIYKLAKDIKGCNALGEYQNIEHSSMDKQDFENYYIDRYYSKSVDEFIDKLNEEDMNKGDDSKYKIKKFKFYFETNNMTVEKIEYIENKTKLNLTKFKDKLRSKK